MGGKSSKKKFSRERVLEEFWDSLLHGGNTKKALEWLERSKTPFEFYDDVDQKMQWDALQWAAYLGKPDFLHEMIDRYDLSPNASVRDRPVEIKGLTVPGKSTALHIAAMRGRQKCVRELLEIRARIEATDADGWTALHRCTQAAHVGTMTELVDSGAGVHAKTKCDVKAFPRGSTPLHIAVRKRNIRVCKLLVSRGADFKSLKDSEGLSCSCLATRAPRHFWDAFDMMTEIQAMKLTLLMTTNRRVGSASPVRLLMKDRVFDPQIFRMIFEYVPTQVETYNKEILSDSRKD
mmetsp:Transcript_27389/g.44064  ORF Transcript_27389/g.44064 Transcript_27389/m.44064 type:complete len:292 (+) Transcript_27389:61-936(+)